MLHNNLILSPYDDRPAIVDKNGEFYSYKSVLRNVSAYMKLIRKLKLTKEAQTVAINFKSNFENVSAILACLAEGVNFTIIDSENSLSETLVKIHRAQITMVLGNTISSSINYLTINEEFTVIKKGYLIDCLSEEQKTEFEEIELQLLTLRQEYDDNMFVEAFSKRNTLREYRHCIVFHGGITDALKASVFTLSAVTLGIDKAGSRLYKNEPGVVLFMEPFNLLYDIVNGVISPMLMGKTIVFGSVIDSEYKLKPDIIYTNSARIESMMKQAENSMTLASLLNKIVLFGSPIANLIKLRAVKRDFKKIFGDKVKTLILTGKLRRKNYNSAFKLINLYVMAEVASFVTHIEFAKGVITPYCVGKVSDKISIEGSPGEVFIHTIDSSVAYLNPLHGSRGFMHNHYGKLRTGDAGYIKEGMLYILNKASEVLLKNGTVIDTEQIRFIAESQDFVNNTLLMKENNKLILIVDICPNFLARSGASWENITFRCDELRRTINIKLKGQLKVHAVVPFPDTDGLKKNNFKLVSRQT